jgi:hypothetical protein
MLVSLEQYWTDEARVESIHVDPGNQNLGALSRHAARTIGGVKGESKGPPGRNASSPVR